MLGRRTLGSEPLGSRWEHFCRTPSKICLLSVSATTQASRESIRDCRHIRYLPTGALGRITYRWYSDILSRYARCASAGARASWPFRHCNNNISVYLTAACLTRKAKVAKFIGSGGMITVVKKWQKRSGCPTTIPPRQRRGGPHPAAAEVG